MSRLRSVLSVPVPVPEYLQRCYGWAYVHPCAVRVFERAWLVNAILFGNYARLRDAALAALSPPRERLRGRTLQLACVYGDLTPRLQQRLAPDGQLDVVDVLPVQLANVASKLVPDERVHLQLADATALPMPDAHYDQVLLFFLLHEQPEAVRRATLAQALRVLRPGGRLVVVDYHRPALWHPLRGPMRLVFALLEPYAAELWRSPVSAFLPPGHALKTLQQRRFFGGLYQLLTLER